jgi:hypothetical protein
MLRAACKSSIPLALSAVARRSIAVFTEQSDILMNNAKHRHFKSNVWFEVEDAWWTKNYATLKPKEAPTQASIQRRIELYNADQLVKRPEELDQRAAHSSARTMAPYSQAFQEELERTAKMHGFASKWWMSEREITKRNANLRQGARPSVIIMRATAQLVNADQFDKPEALAAVPLSAATKKPYARELQELLSADVEKNKYPTGLYFTVKQLEALGLDGLVKPEAPFVAHNMTFRGFTVYNVDELADSENILKSLQRFPVTTDSYLLSGKPVGATLAPNLAAAGKKSKYWVSERDVEARKWKVLPGCKGVSADAKEGKQIMFYSVHQLSNPAEGFKKAGTKAL